MNQIVKINDVHMEVKDYKGQRVVTFKDIDMVHQRPEGTASRNFLGNKRRFIEGEDFFFVSSSQNNEIRGFEIPTRGITLLTESGYLMLVKSFNDDLAWEVQRKLVNGYFRLKDDNFKFQMLREFNKSISTINSLKGVVTHKEQRQLLKEVVSSLGIDVDWSPDTELLRLESESADAIIKEFIHDRCVFGYEKMISKRDLYEAYLKWCKHKNINPLPIRSLAKHITSYVIETKAKRIKSKVFKAWSGVDLKRK